MPAYRTPGSFGLTLPLRCVPTGSQKFQYRGRLYQRLADELTAMGNVLVRPVWGRNRPGCYSELSPDAEVREWNPAGTWNLTSGGVLPLGVAEYVFMASYASSTNTSSAITWVYNGADGAGSSLTVG